MCVWGKQVPLDQDGLPPHKAANQGKYVTLSRVHPSDQPPTFKSSWQLKHTHILQISIWEPLTKPGPRVTQI